MSLYPGLVVGGPLDGQLIQKTSPSFRVAFSPPPSFVVDEYSPIVDDFEYIHLTTPIGVHFWAQRGETLQTALTKLAVGYINYAEFMRR